MASPQTPSTLTLNARVGAAAMAIGAPLNLLLHMRGQALAPLSYAAWLGLSFGLLCFCDEMGAGKPLNRAGLVLFAAAFLGDTAATFAVDPAVIARARLLCAFTTLGALVLWSVALMHRAHFAKAIGAIGTAVGGGGLILLVAAHLLLGASTIFGFSELFAALDQSGRTAVNTLAVIDGLLCAWGFMAASLLGSGRLRS